MAYMPHGSRTRRYCDCEDYPCCGHTDDDGSDDRTDEEIKQSVYDGDDLDWPDHAR